MKIGIDTSTITEDKAGIGYYTYSIVKELLENDKENTYTLFTNNISNLKSFKKEISKNTEIVEIKAERPGFFWIRKVVRHLYKEKFDRFVSPTNFLFGILFPKTIQIVHDLAPIKHPEFFTKKGSVMYKLLLNLAINRTHKIGVPCKTIREELIKYNIKSQNKLFVTGEGLHKWTELKPDNSKQSAVKAKYNLPKNFMLSLSTIEPRKNHTRVVRAFAEISKEFPDLHYVIGGKKGWFYDEVFESVERLGLTDKVHFLGYIPEDDIPHLFDLAKFFVYCSIYEGFGIPCIEAYSRGIPVLAGDIPSLRETMEDKAMYADPLDYRDITLKLREMIAINHMKVDSEFLSKHSWKLAAEAIIKEYE
jgi:glycosyltransferase involved in cell wall biosynthesis